MIKFLFRCIVGTIIGVVMWLAVTVLTILAAPLMAIAFILFSIWLAILLSLEITYDLFKGDNK